MSHCLDDEVQVYLQKIGKASKRMQQLVNDVLTLSRHTNDNLNFKETDLNVILMDVLSDLEMDIQKKNAKINAANLPVIYAIPSQISQLFQNIISNSIKFSRPDCTPEIYIQTEAIKGADINEVDITLSENIFYRIYIKDNGIGFDTRYIDDIFIIFKRLHSYHEFEGTGIGLSICKKIVEKHNGFITSQSQINEGSTFIITLPEKILEV
jgi:light-regulated signal transduction histidine kinase (bacteriophytochrome)